MSEASKFTVTLAQLNPTVGDVTGNAARARTARKQAAASGAEFSRKGQKKLAKLI